MMGSNREVRLRQRFWQDENDVNIKPLPRRRNQNESEQHVENPTASAEPRNFLDNLDTIVDPPASPHQHGSSVLRELLFDVEAASCSRPDGPTSSLADAGRETCWKGGAGDGWVLLRLHEKALLSFLRVRNGSTTEISISISVKGTKRHDFVSVKPGVRLAHGYMTDVKIGHLPCLFVKVDCRSLGAGGVSLYELTPVGIPTATLRYCMGSSMEDLTYRRTERLLFGPSLRTIRPTVCPARAVQRLMMPPSHLRPYMVDEYAARAQQPIRRDRFAYSEAGGDEEGLHAGAEFDTPYRASSHDGHVGGSKTNSGHDDAVRRAKGFRSCPSPYRGGNPQHRTPGRDGHVQMRFSPRQYDRALCRPVKTNENHLSCPWAGRANSESFPLRELQRPAGVPAPAGADPSRSGSTPRDSGPEGESRPRGGVGHARDGETHEDFGLAPRVAGEEENAVRGGGYGAGQRAGNVWRSDGTYVGDGGIPRGFSDGNRDIDGDFEGSFNRDYDENGDRDSKQSFSRTVGRDSRVGGKRSGGNSRREPRSASVNEERKAARGRRPGRRSDAQQFPEHRDNSIFPPRLQELLRRKSGDSSRESSTGNVWRQLGHGGRGSRQQR